MPVPRLDMSQIVKVHDPAAYIDIQAVPTDSKLHDVRVFPLIRSGRCVPPGRRSHENSSKCSLKKETPAAWRYSPQSGAPMQRPSMAARRCTPLKRG
jgi:hypothetical protein